MHTAAERLGFMQGRLSPQVDGKIQAFPVGCWRDEFEAAERLGLTRMEWTLDQEGLLDNPLMSPAGRAEIARLSRQHHLQVYSVCGDCFMHAPFWKSSGAARERLYATLESVVDATAEAGAKILVIALVDNGSLENAQQEALLIDGMTRATPHLRSKGLRVAFESDYPPEQLAAFVARFPGDTFGVNFDMGNSASLGWDPKLEVTTLAPRIINVHVKDRVLGGTTVPLGEGHADLPRVFLLLEDCGYQGSLILQTARAADGDHAGVLSRYREMVLRWAGA
jgi:hexulose-6-phosphate isomerase